MKLREAALGLMLLGMIWSVLVYSGHIAPYFLPSPREVILSLETNASVLFTAAMNTLGEALLGFFLAFILAFCLGCSAYFWISVRVLLRSFAVMSQAMPALILSPLIILWLGFSLRAKLLLIVLSLFFPIFSAWVDAFLSVPQRYLDLAQSLRATRFRLFWQIVFPWSLPQLASGLRVAAAWAMLSAIVAEWMGGSVGLGFLMQNALSRFDTALLFAALLVLVILTLLFYALVDHCACKLVFWKREALA